MERAAFLIQDPRRGGAQARLSCLLNPRTLVFRRRAGLERRRTLAGALTQDGLRDDPLLETGGGVTELRVDLLFDVDIPGAWPGTRVVSAAAPAVAAVTGTPGAPTDEEAEDERDVRELTRPIWDLAENQPRPGAAAGPPPIRFGWGKRWDFAARVAAVAERLERFTASGIPRRSFLRLCLVRVEDRQEPEDVLGAAPLSPGAAPLLPVPALEPISPLDVLPPAEQPPAEAYEPYVSPGFPMFLTAFAFYGDASRWTEIAEANPDVSPVFVPPGTLLRIPVRGRLAAP